MAGIVTLLTDFGLRDGYVAAVKGVLLARAPGLALVDVAHEIEPGDVAGAAYVLLQAAPHFPADTVHLVVVDPGVGSARRALAARLGPQFFVAPDNGVLSLVLQLTPPSALHEIRDPLAGQSSAVFHGRDVFAPAAAALSSGAPIASLGPAVEPESLVRLEAGTTRTPGDTSGSIQHVDRFGNLISNLRVAPGARGEAEIRGSRIAMADTYSDVEPGALLALCGSSGFLEVACNGASAAERLGASRGDVISFRLPQRS